MDSSQNQILEQTQKQQLALQEITSSNIRKQQQQIKQEAEIEHLQQQVASIILFDIPDHSSIQSQIKQLTTLIDSLTSQLLNQTNSSQALDRAKHAEISQLEDYSTSLINASKTNFILDKEQLDKIELQINGLKGSISAQSAVVEQLNYQLLKGDQKLQHTQRQIEKTSLSQQQQDLKIANIQKDQAQYDLLLQQYQILQKQQQHLNQELNAEKQQKQSAKTQLKKSIHKDADELAQLKKIHQAQNQVAKSLGAQLADLQKANHQRTAEKDKAVLLLEKQVANKQAEIESLRRSNNNKKEEVKREDQRIAEEQKKMKKAKNYKDLIKSAYIQNQSLLKTKQNQFNIYNKTIQNKSTYSTRQTLNILQRELSRHQIQKNVSVQSRTKQLQKLEKTNKALKDKIKTLTRLVKESQAKEQKYLNDSSKSRDSLLLEKLAADKLITEKTNKLNEYIKNFPSHQQDKQQKKKLKIKKTESVTITQPQKHQKSSRLSKEEKAAKQEQKLLKQVIEESQGSQIFNETKWYKRRTSIDYQMSEDVPIYKNFYFQAAGVLLVLLVATVVNLD